MDRYRLRQLTSIDAQGPLRITPGWAFLRFDVSICRTVFDMFGKRVDRIDASGLFLGWLTAV